MRGTIDLHDHKLAGLYKPRAKPIKRTVMVKCPDEAYRQVWRLADGAVRDCFANHPEYLTAKGKMHARLSLVKRVAGTFHGYATQVAWGGSETSANVADAEAAKATDSTSDGAAKTRGFVTELRVARGLLASLWRRWKMASPKILR